MTGSPSSMLANGDSELQNHKNHTKPLSVINSTGTRTVPQRAVALTGNTLHPRQDPFLFYSVLHQTILLIKEESVGGKG